MHRLDKGTSGCLVVAKHPEAHRKLSEQFAAKTAGRHYWARVQGDVERLRVSLPPRLVRMIEEHPLKLAFRIDSEGRYSFSSPLGRDPKNRLRFAVLPEGKQAVTHFKVLSKNADSTLLDVQLETGRTHQIRVHMAFLGFPLVGDGLYGGRAHDRILLHAHTLYFTHPRTDERMEIRTLKNPSVFLES